jgi:pentatricopeptide repeat protein
VFDGISHKNCISWNICLKGLFRHGQVKRAGNLFDEMPVRDVTWNMIISFQVIFHVALLIMHFCDSLIMYFHLCI